jgi:hypothetical protein
MSEPYFSGTLKLRTKPILGKWEIEGIGVVDCCPAAASGIFFLKDGEYYDKIGRYALQSLIEQHKAKKL